MLQADAKRLGDRIQALWSRWMPNDEEIGAWVRLFAYLEDYDDALRAINRHWQESRRLSPVPNNVRNIYNSIRQSKGREYHKDDYGKTSVWIQCVEAPPQFPNRLGRYLEVMFGQDKQIPSDPGKVLTIADKMRGQHETLYGGCWVVQDGWTREQVEYGKTRLIEAAAGDCKPSPANRQS